MPQNLRTDSYITEETVLHNGFLVSLGWVHVFVSIKLAQNYIHRKFNFNSNKLVNWLSVNNGND